MKKFTPEQVISIREARASGTTVARIADVYGTTRQTITWICQGKSYADIGGPITEAGSIENHPSRAFTDEEVADFRQRALRGVSAASMAKEHDVDPETVRRAIIGETYGHVPMPEGVERIQLKPKGIMDEQTTAMAVALKGTGLSIRKIADQLGISKSTVARALKQHDERDAVGAEEVTAS